MQNSLKNMISEYDNLLMQITFNKQQYAELNKQLRNLQNQLILECDHEWVVDNSSVNSEHLSYICKVCGLYDGYYNGIHYHPKYLV
jgi:small-conductance mechanosensitive channel